MAAQRSEAAKRIAVKAINRALEGLKVPTIVHLCFGYAALVPGETKPVGYSFLPQLADSTADQISIEAAQPKLDLGVLKDLAGKTSAGGDRPQRPQGGNAAVVAERIRAGLKHLAADKLIPAPDCGMKYLPRALPSPSWRPWPRAPPSSGRNSLEPVNGRDSFISATGTQAFFSQRPSAITLPDNRRSSQLARFHVVSHGARARSTAPSSRPFSNTYTTRA